MMVSVNISLTIHAKPLPFARMATRHIILVGFRFRISFPYTKYVPSKITFTVKIITRVPYNSIRLHNRLYPPCLAQLSL